MKKKSAWFWVVLVIITIVFIWSNSLADASHSSAVSGGLTDKLLAFLDPQGKLDRDFFEFCLRKFAHFSEFALLGAEFVFLKKNFNKVGIFAILFSCMSVALVDETLQLLSDRSSEVRDVWIDFSGAVFGVFVICFIFIFLKMVKKEH